MFLQFIKLAVTHTIASIVFFVSGCESDQYLPGVNKTWFVGAWQIHESIRQSKNNWPDPVFLRTYRLTSSDENTIIFNYENQSKDGILETPYLIDDELIILTSHHIYRIGSSGRVDKFYPRMTKRWRSFSRDWAVNGSYDYHAKGVSKVGEQWYFTYSYKRAPSRYKIGCIVFVTGDDWATFEMQDQDIASRCDRGKESRCCTVK